jgi:hypothetical protein
MNEVTSENEEVERVQKYELRSKKFKITSDERSPVDVACFAPNYIECSGHSKI